MQIPEEGVVTLNSILMRNCPRGLVLGVVVVVVVLLYVHETNLNFGRVHRDRGYENNNNSPAEAARK
jgi:hypothetical protein